MYDVSAGRFTIWILYFVSYKSRRRPNYIFLERIIAYVYISNYSSRKSCEIKKRNNKAQVSNISSEKWLKKTRNLYRKNVYRILYYCFIDIIQQFELWWVNVFHILSDNVKFKSSKKCVVYIIFNRYFHYLFRHSDAFTLYKFWYII